MSDIRDQIKEIVREARHNPYRADHGMYSHEWYADRILARITAEEFRTDLVSLISYSRQEAER